MKVLLTGSAGFIGNDVALSLLERGDAVVGLDNLNPYYDVALKEARLARIAGHPGFTEARIDLADRDAMSRLFAEHKPDRVIHLAAQAGVRYSLDNPHAYVESNVTGFLNVLEGCRTAGVGYLLYASSSSVYGTNARLPFSADDPVDHPISLYAATKRANELMAHSYSHLFGLPVTGLRLFTVYGPWGRPDMALFLFTKAILADKPIEVFNQGRMRRAFTYIDDVVAGILGVLDMEPPVPSGPSGNNNDDPSASATAPFRIYNIGHDKPVKLMRYIEVLEEALGRKAKTNMLPMQPGDVPATWADVDDLRRDVGFEPTTTVEEGVRRFVEWYKTFYGVA